MKNGDGLWERVWVPLAAGDERGCWLRGLLQGLQLGVCTRSASSTRTTQSALVRLPHGGFPCAQPDIPVHQVSRRQVSPSAALRACDRPPLGDNCMWRLWTFTTYEYARLVVSQRQTRADLFKMVSAMPAI